MKRKLFFLAALLLATVMNLSATDMDTLYLNTGGNTLWNQDGAKFSAFYWNDGVAGKFTDFLELAYGETDIYRAIIPKSDSVNFVRHAATAEVPSWDNKLHYTKGEEVNLEDNGNMMIVDGWGPTDRYWDNYTPKKGPDTLNYLHFVSLKAGGSVKMKKEKTPAEPVLEYSKDNRKSWSKFDIANGTTFDNVGDTIWFRAGKDGVAGKNATISKSVINYYYFAFGENDSIAAGGNVMSLLDGTCAQKSVPDGSFSYLFSNAKQLISAPELPATTIAGSCYAYMFYNCTNLVTAPELPATMTAASCYVAMFRGCTKLENGPTSLPAAVLETSCYSNMFLDCAKLKNAPAMNVTTLAMMCCYSMFSGCSHLMVDPYEGECDGVEMQFNHEGSEPSSWNSTMFAGCQGTVSQPTIGGHYCVKGVKEPDMHDFLYFVSLKDNGTVKLNKMGINYANLTATFEYSTDRINWTEYKWSATDGKTGDAIALANAGDTVFFRALGANKDGKNAEMSISASAYYKFVFGTKDSIAAGGNAMSLYDATCEQKTMTEYGFTQLFNGAKRLISAPKLPATTLAPSCYMGMFQKCTTLITSQDALPAPTLVESCYEHMFDGCTALTQAPELTATTLAKNCYADMFNNCSALEVNTFSSSCDGAELVVPDTTAAPDSWNSSMFVGCKGDAALTALHGIQLGGHYCISEYKEPDMHDFLYFVSLKDNGTVRLNKDGNQCSDLTATFEYSKNRKIWREYTWDAYSTTTVSCEGKPIALNQGDTVFFRAKGVNGKNNELSKYRKTYRFAFGENDSIAAGGNAMSLYDATCEQDAMTAYGFASLFNNDGSEALVSAPKLPATKLAEKCYASMFNECVALTTAPALPATELAKGCYEAMFSGCYALTQAPELKATALVEGCYSIMFQSCHALTAAPALPAMELAKNCYAFMFYDCPALTKAPELMAFTLADSCYMNMFTDCSKLEVNVNTISKSCNGAELVVPQTSAAYDWNFEMFSGCKGDAALTAEYGIQLNGHYCISEYKEPDMHDMLHFVSLKDNGTVRLNKYGGNDLDKLTATFEYSTDRKTWTEYTWGGTDNKKGAAITLASAGDTVFFRAKGTNGKNATLSYNDVTYFLFVFNTGDSIAAGGNVMSLYDAECKQDTMTAYGFSNLFKDCAKKLVSVSELKLPVTKLAKGCYYAMFYNCLKITDVPALPVTTLAPSCYVFMFYRCTSLTVAPVLPATTLADNCYSNMFSGCTALTQAPELPAITLASKCYNLMFAGCSSLTVAPELNATTLADSCYKQMFKGCSKLEVDTCSGSCAGVVFVPTTMGYAPINWNINMFDGCKGDAKYTAEYGIQLGGHYCISEYKEPDMHDLLYFVSLKDNGTVQLDKVGIQGGDLTATFEYSKDRKTWTECTWSAYASGSRKGSPIALNQGDSVFFRAKGTDGKNAIMSLAYNKYYKFIFGENDSIAAGGNAMSLYDATCEQDTMTAYGFYNLFRDAKQLVSAPKLPATKMARSCYQYMFQGCSDLTTTPVLPATELAASCYSSMFLECTSLTVAPELKATTLAERCYESMFQQCYALPAAPQLPGTELAKECYARMFQECTALNTAPALPATTLAETCYRSMFDSCVSLIQAPELKATALVKNCYEEMFQGCTSLTIAPVLPAMELVESCYEGMFRSCTSLTQAPELPATTLAESCYEWMFTGCTSLTAAPALPATNLETSCYSYMFYECTALTTIPTLSATNLADECYYCMFQNCSSLEVDTCADGNCDGVKFEPTASEAPSDWNESMFSGCHGAYTEVQLGGHYCVRKFVDRNDYLYLVGLNGNDTVRLNKYATADKNLADLTATFEYSKDRKTWTEYTWGTYGDPVTKTALGAAIELAKGDTVFFRAKGVDGKNATMSDSHLAYFLFGFGENDSIAAGGNVMSLYDATCEQDTMTRHGLRNLFYKAKQLVSAPKLPATKLARTCYTKMFVSNYALTTAPELPATTLDYECYFNMFYDCTALTQAPELKATTLAQRCYVGMFQNCTALQVDTCTGSCAGAELVVPSIGATDWNDDMFKGCKGTVTTPQLGGHYCVKEYVPIMVVVKYDLQGYGEAIKNDTIISGNLLTQPADPTDANHEFMGWFKEEACQNAFDFSQAITAPQDTTITLYAKWEKAYVASKTSFTAGDENGFMMDDNITATVVDGSVNEGALLINNSITLKAPYGYLIRSLQVVYSGMGLTCNKQIIDKKGAKFTLSPKDSICTLVIDAPLSPQRKAPMASGAKITSITLFYEKLEPDMHDFLYFVSLKDNGTVRMNKKAMPKDVGWLTATFEYSKDRTNWTDYTFSPYTSTTYTYPGDLITLNQGDTVFFRAKGKDGKNAMVNYGAVVYFNFAFGTNDSIVAGGNTMSLYDATCTQDTMTAYGFSSLFNSAKQLISAPQLPATKLETGCYQSMFLGCTALTQAPELKATTLVKNCYNTMFKNCTALQVDTCTGSCDGAELVVPSTGADDWNKDMFKNCKGDTALTAQYGIQLGGHYCIKEFVPDSIKGIELVAVDTVYDGQEHFITVNGTIEGDVVTYSTDSATWKDAFAVKDVSDTTVFVRIQRTDHYDWYGKSSITITPRHITLTSDSASKAYDAKVLTCEKVTVGGDEFVDGEGADYSDFYVVKYVSPTGASTPNTFTYKFNESTKETNYVVDTVIYGMLNITPSQTPIEITAGSEDKMYDGEPFFYDKGYSVTGEFFGKDNLNRIQMKDTVVNAGTYPNRILICYIENNSGVDVTPCYGNITFVDGTLEITPRELFVSGLTMQDKTYDGTDSAAVGTAGVLEGVVGSDDVNIAATTATFADANAGKDKEVTVIYTLGGNDADNYSISEEMASATINKRELTLESADLTKEYDGTPLTAKGTTIKANGYVKGECLKYSLPGSQTAVGESPNFFDYSDSETALVTNYDVTAIYGKLEVIASTELITITANSDSKIYDGTPLTNNGYQVDGTLAAGDYVGNVVVTGTITQVGSVPNEVTGYGIYNAGGEDVTTFYSNIQRVAGTLIVVSDKSTCAEANLVEAELPIGLQTVTVAYVNGAYTYIQDETGGALIYANNYGLKAGDRVSGIQGVSNPLEGGLPSIQPTKKVEQLTIVSGPAPEPKTRVATPIIAEIHQYVRYENVTIDADKLTPAESVEATLANTDKVMLNSRFGRTFLLNKDLHFDIVALVGVNNDVIELYPTTISVHIDTAIENVNGNTNQVVEKFVQDGKLYIRVDGILYNANGVRVK